MSSNNTNIPFLSSNDMDQFDQKMASIMQSSISMMFRQLIEPVDSGKYDIDTSKTLTTKQPPPLKLHDFGGSDFVRLAEKSRRNRTCISSRSQGMMVSSLDRPTPMNKTYNSSSKHNENINSLTLMDKTGKEQEQQEQQEQQQGSSILNNKDWKCTQECIYRTDGSEETVYQKYENGVATETLHHVLYPDGTIKDIKKTTMIPSSPSITSSLSSMAESTISTPHINDPFKRLWHLVFD